MSQSISVVIPTYNSASYLQEALESVSQQTVAVDEIIVVDDGSTDETHQVIQSFDVTYLYQKNAGAAAARNAGVAAVQGELIAFLDADDLWLPTKIEQQVSLLTNEPTIDMVFGHIEHFLSPDVADSVGKKLYCPTEAIPAYLPTTMMVRTQSWHTVGDLDGSWQVGEFINWYLLAQERGLQSHMLPAVVARRRLHRTNQGVVKREDRRDYLHILKARLDRKRRQEMTE